LTGSLIHMSCNTGAENTRVSKLTFDEDLWNEVVEETVKSGQNALFIAIGDAVILNSHPEIAIPGAWTRQKLRHEIRRLKDMGITLMPKMNFSFMHDGWLGIYGKMPTTPTYYHVCRDIILEVCHLFPDAPYFHLGMDEEFPKSIHSFETIGIVRQNDLFWHDVNFLLECVREGGKTPVIWDGQALHDYENFKKNVSPEEVVIFQTHYHAVKKEHWTRIDSEEKYRMYYSTREPYKYMNLTYVEEDPYYDNFRKYSFKMMEDGYDCMMGVSTYYENPYNTEDVIELYTQQAPPERLKGIFMLSWLRTIPEYRDRLLSSIRELTDGLKKYEVL
ncbi:MAG: family 20 glycosylhydrolase, partial [Clostridia bacterium]|nr:family 20 glycosylhydrolase [Clostridia bacterium]